MSLQNIVKSIGSALKDVGYQVEMAIAKALGQVRSQRRVHTEMRQAQSQDDDDFRTEMSESLQARLDHVKRRFEHESRSSSTASHSSFKKVMR